MDLPEGERLFRGECAPARLGRDPALFGLVGRLGGLVFCVGIALIIWSLVGLGGCASEYHVRAVAPPASLGQPPLAGLGRVCVLRPQTFGAVAGVRHYDNGALVGVTRGARTFFCYRVRPGWHRLSAVTDNRAVLMLAVAPGQTAYARLELRMGPDALVAVQPAQGPAMAQGLTYVVSSPAEPGVEAPSRAPVAALPGRPR